MPAQCPKCGFNSESSTECLKCGIVFESYWKRLKRSSASQSTGSGEVDSSFSIYSDLVVNTIALPAMFLFIVLCKILQLPGLILSYFFSIPTHEMGHALVALLGGRFAIPIGALVPMVGFTFISDQKSIFVTLGVLGLLSALAYYSLLQRCIYLFLVSCSLALSCIYLSWIMTAEKSAAAFIYGGIAGEFVLGAFLIVSFYYSLPQAWRWDFFRWIALLIGSQAYLSAYVLWLKIQRGAALMPLGSFTNGSDDSGGDLDRLMFNYGWSPQYVKKHFVHLGAVCLVLIASHYFYFLWKAYLQKNKSL